MREEDRKVYDRALADYSLIIRSGGNSLEQIESCLRALEEFEDYEKCRDLLEILKAYRSKSIDKDNKKNP